MHASRLFSLAILAAGLGGFVCVSRARADDKEPLAARSRADVLGMTGLSETERKTEALRRNGDRAIQIGEFDDAARAYAQAVLRSPNDPVLRLLTGVSLTTIRKPDVAVAQFKVACRLTGDDLVASLLLQGALAQTGQSDAAQTVYLEAVRRYGKPSGGLDSSASLVRLKAALKTTPNSPILHLLVGDAYQIAENLPAANAAYRTAISFAPGWANPKVNLGLLRLAQDKPVEAVQLFESALKRDPENVALQFFRADAQREAGNLKGAIANYQRIQTRTASRGKTAPINAQALTGLGQAYAAGGRLEDALTAFNQARVIAPTDPAPPAAIGEVQTKKRDFEAAAQNYKDALRLTKASGLFGTQAVLYQALAQTQIAGKQTNAALQTLERALREQPESAGLWHRLRGEAMLSVGNQIAAEAAFRASLDAQADAGVFPQETLAVIASKGLLDDITAGYRANLSASGGGFARSMNTAPGSVGVIGRPADASPERETRALIALAAIAQYQSKTAEELAYREELTRRRSRGADWFALADAYDGRARDAAKAKQAYRQALNLGGLSDAQTERARLRMKQFAGVGREAVKP
ncbi:MAG: tetratricopeptide repeat protein [Akkermansiaceae bacterium]|nr:tetratricopeptide repeat protein [Armatimonadota bacterium]